jgi:hypothetical protein
VRAGWGLYGLPPEIAVSVPITGSPARAAADHLVLGIIGDDWLRQCELIAEARALLD